ncbi:MAG: DUF2163 domain-containing protein [Proteobacteria bacterium]|nr:DUF2163 domain-containing protein [Pseudomonadota bacterium]
MPPKRRRILEATLRQDLASFITRVFSVTNPGTKYIPSWHIDIIAEYLNACTRGEIHKLIINLPPRAMKSLCVSVAWPAWLLGHDPSRRIIAASYAQAISIKHSLDCRLVVQSNWYRSLFPYTLLTKDQNQKAKFQTTARGYRLASSVGGSVTGEGAQVKEADLMAGLYDFAEIEIFKVNYTDLSQGTLKLRRGWIGEVSVNKGQFVAEVRGLMQALSQTIGELYSPSCRASLGDSRCKIAMEPYTRTGSITSVTDNTRFADSTRVEAAGYFTFGKITFTSGANNGLSMEVKEYVPGKITLALPMPFAVVVGDTYSMTAGCDKTIETCIVRFANAVNFRGEPHVPGTDRMLQTAGTRTEW